MVGDVCLTPLPRAVSATSVGSFRPRCACRYAVDFGGSTPAVLRWIRPYLAPDVQEQLDKALAAPKLRVEYFPYDWSANGKV